VQQKGLSLAGGQANSFLRELWYESQLCEEPSLCNASIKQCLQVCWNSTVEEAFGNEKGLLGGVKLKDVKTGELKDVEVGVSCADGHSLPTSTVLFAQL